MMMMMMMMMMMLVIMMMEIERERINQRTSKKYVRAYTYLCTNYLSIDTLKLITTTPTKSNGA
jgi:hypothetical protein